MSDVRIEDMTEAHVAAVQAHLADPVLHVHTADRLAAFVQDFRSRRMLAVVVTDAAARVVGAVSLRGHECSRPQILYWLGRPYWGYGYATAAVRQVILRAFAEPHIDAIDTCVAHENTRSLAVLLRLGFVQLELARPRPHVLYYSLRRANFAR